MKKVVRSFAFLLAVVAVTGASIFSNTDGTVNAENKQPKFISSGETIVVANAATKKKKTSYKIDKYLKDGKFTKKEWTKYCKEMGGKNTVALDSNEGTKKSAVAFDFPKYNFSVYLSNSASEYDCALIILTEYYGDTVDGWHWASEPFSEDGKNIAMFDDGTYVPKSVMHPLEKTIKYAKKHPGASKKPSIGGMKFVTFDTIDEEHHL